MATTATLVGGDITEKFLEIARQKSQNDPNISFVKSDITCPLAAELRETFDLTTGRLVLAWCGAVGIDVAITNIASSLAPGGWLQIQDIDSTLAPDDPELLERAQPPREEGRRHPWDAATDLVEPSTAAEQLAQHEGRPPVAEDLGAARHGAELAVVDHPLHGRQTGGSGLVQDVD